MSTSRPDHLPALTGLRALGALWILAFHLAPQFKLFFGSMGIAGELMRFGYYAVDLFFVLSGFVIAHRYADQLCYKTFLKRRLMRIYPLHLAMLLLVLAMVTAAPLFGFSINRGDDYQLGNFIAHLFMVSAWQFPATLSWNHYAWAVSAEWLAYLLTPLFFAAILHTRRSDARLLWLVALTAFCPMVAYFFPHDSAAAYAIPRVIAGFGLGVLAYGAFNRNAREKSVLSLLVIVAIGACLWLETQMPLLRFLPLPLFAALIMALGNPNDVLARQLARRPWQFLGHLSYALYITQFVVVMALRKIVPAEHLFYQSAAVHAAYLIGEIAAIFIFAILCHYYIERPAFKASTRFPNAS